MPEGDRRDVAGGLVLSPAPHLVASPSTARMSWLVVVGLLPCLAWGVLMFGPRALLVVAVSTFTAAAAELLSSFFLRKFTLGDGSAVLAGLLVGLLMPAGVPLHVPAAASAFGILVVKQSFGGMGRNWMHPAVGGVLFALLSWSDGMNRWLTVAGGAPGGSPPLEALRAMLLGSGPRGGAPLAVLNAQGYPFSAIDTRVVAWINDHLLAFLGISLREGTFDIVTGHVPGVIGAVSAPLVLAGAAFLLARRIVRWEVPVAYIVTFGALALVFGGLATGQGWMNGGTLFQVVSGNLLLCAFFIAPDPVTSPLYRRARIAYAVLMGVITFFLRFFGSLGDGVVVSLALGNAAVPLLDKLPWGRLPRTAQGGAG